MFTLDDLRVVLEPDLGPLHGLKLTPATDPSTTTAAWFAIDTEGDLVNGNVSVQLERQEDGSFLVKPIVTIAGPSGRLLELPWRGLP